VLKETPEFCCEHCHSPIDRDLLLRYAGAIINSRRKIARGKPRVIYKCGCGGLFSAREFRAHETAGCGKAPPRSQVLANPYQWRANEEDIAHYYSEKGQRPFPAQ